MQKNIVYGSLTAGGDVRNGDKIYVIERDFPHSILFLRIEKGASGYEAMLSIKSEDDLTINLFRETLKVVISESLFGRVDEFQSFRRGGDGNRYRSAFDTHSPENWEMVLAEELYNTFFSGDIGTVCCDFLSLLQSHKINELLLVISTEDEQIQNLPWEMVLPKLTPGGANELPRDNFGLIRSREKTLQRFNRQGPTAEAAPLKLLFIPALPENLPGKSQLLEIEEEQRKIIEAVRSLEATGDQQPKLVMEILDCANLEEIKEALAARSHDIVHISGHGSYVDAVKEGVLYLEDEDGNERQTTGRELGKALNGFSSIKLLVLSACETAVGGSVGSTAEQMAAVGLPAVLAMRFSVTDAGARLFTEILYKRLAYGYTLTKSVHDARLALWEHAQERRKNAPTVFTPAEWFTPVLYQNQAIGALVKKGQYHTETLNRFYPKPAFIRGSHTRLIGEGFIGRKRLLIRLRQSFKQGKAVCLHGLGGLGKTTTAEAFAEHYRKRNSVHDILIFRNGANIQEAVILETVYERWKSRTKPEDWLANEVKASLDDPKNGIEQKLQYLIDNCLNGHRTILIFDNFEDVQTDEDGTQQQGIVSESLRSFLRYLLQHIPPVCHILFTTRYAIADLADLVTNLAIDKMSYAEQYRYLNFSETLRRLPTKERDIIHRRIDGHPRALEFLESLYTKDQSFDLSVLDKVEGKISESLLLERVLNRLNGAEREVFTVASVFFSRTPLSALSAVMENKNQELIPVLASLRDWSLCVWDETAQTFEIHALTRAWMRGQGKPDQNQFKSLSESAGNYFRKESTVEAGFKAIQYFENADAWARYVETVFWLENHFYLIGLYSNGNDLNQTVLKKDISPENNARALNNLGLIRLSIGDYAKALECLEQALVIMRQIGDIKGEHKILADISHIYIAWGEYNKVFLYLKKTLEVYRLEGYKKGEGVALESIGRIFYQQGNYVQALAHLEESLKIYRQCQYKIGEGAALNNIGLVYIEQENYPKALEHLEQGLEVHRQIGDIRGQGSSLNDIGQIYMYQKKYTLAIDYFENSLKIRQQIGDKDGIGTTITNIGYIYFYQKEYKLSLEHFENSLKIYRQTGNISQEGICLNNISQIFSARGDYSHALEYLEQCRKIHRKVGDKTSEGLALYNIGILYLQKLRDIENAIRFLLLGLNILRQIDSPKVNLPEGWLNLIIQKIGEERFNQILESIKNNPPT
ncbi:tetratricopeptide repeat protein [Larkinella punicea]|uniref:CHAT domain-containing protein n=1 Tax=Larkinella punicea TaxID=2315727 RepID=A0A368JP05_9BACT|nr:tetratricopeptide repeat protein [Larkinella punicea]RCR69035.1 CHAT domain-containing protein [Larkinella punicea]